MELERALHLFVFLIRLSENRFTLFAPMRSPIIFAGG